MNNEDLPFLFRRRLGAMFARREITIAGGGTRVYDESEWRGALVAVRHGRIELETLAGARRVFGYGDTMWLTGLPIRALHNPDPEPAVLVALSVLPGEGGGAE
ncbi:hypothetical protein [Actinomadura alba]|uniref:AraC family transcriptional regulator n=1 Tax=Actinomadura alba TaxID=406431 RepID=A0ABR7LSU4_9ACTN|nr:hypothetical protein [Actinomadura alba]MBC6467577.1 hypothetical protein [Actinomadura alba]